MRAAALAVLVGLPAAAGAVDLPLPGGATLQLEEHEPDGRYAMPVGPFDRATGVPVRTIEGPVTARAWRVRAGPTAQQLVRPLRAALREAGWTVVLDCAAPECGGFDFRFATRVLPAPAMFVDLAAYRAVSAVGPDGSGIAILASRDPVAGYVQIVRAGDGAGNHPDGAGDPVLPEPPPDAPATPEAGGDIVAALEREGHAILSDMRFASGAATLDGGGVASLDRLAAYLRDNPDRRLLFVGHTDATGSLDANAALSRQRAMAAVDYLDAQHGLGPDRVAAEGAGFLAPVATNLTEEGRRANRRVEAVLLPLP